MYLLTLEYLLLIIICCFNNTGRDPNFQLLKVPFSCFPPFVFLFFLCGPEGISERRDEKEKGLLCVIVAPVTTVYLVLFC